MALILNIYTYEWHKREKVFVQSHRKNYLSIFRNKDMIENKILNFV